jgi:hypothetical protein
MGCLNIVRMVVSPRSSHPFGIPVVRYDVVVICELFVTDSAFPVLLDDLPTSVITSKAANSYHFKTGQRDWPSRTENVLLCRLLWWQVGFGTPASGATLEHVAVMQ